MNVISSPGTLGNETGDRSGSVAAPAAIWLALASLVLSSQVAAQEKTAQQQEQPAAQEQTPAVLKLREVNFNYRSRLTYWSCDDLERRVAIVMRVLGARDDVNVSATGCDTVVMPMDESFDIGSSRSDPSDPWQNSSTDRWRTSSDRFGSTRNNRREQSSHVRIRAMMPTQVTPEVLAEINKDKSRRELVSRVTGNAAALDDAIIFPAQRQLVTLSYKTVKLEPEECELIEQMSRSVFRQLNLRVVRGSHGCDRNQISNIPLQVTVEALMPWFPPGPQLAPEEPQSQPQSQPQSGEPPSAPAESGAKPAEQPGTAPPPQ